MNESTARQLSWSHGQGNWWWSKWDAGLYMSNFFSCVDSWDRFYLKDSVQKESTRAGLSWLEEWLRHPQQHKRTQQAEFCIRSSWGWWKSCQRNRAVYGQQEMDVEQRGLSLSSLHKVAIDTVIAVAFTKTQQFYRKHDQSKRKLEDISPLLGMLGEIHVKRHNRQELSLFWAPKNIAPLPFDGILGGIYGGSLWLSAQHYSRAIYSANWNCENMTFLYWGLCIHTKGTFSSWTL